MSHAVVSADRKGHRSLAVSQSQLQEISIWLLTAGIAWFNLTSLDQHKYDVGIDATVLFKLAMTFSAGAIGAWGLFARRDVRTFFLEYPGLIYSALLVVILASSITSISPVASLASTFALYCISSFTVYGSIRLGPERMLGAIVMGLAVYVVTSWLAYLFVPEIGLFLEDLGGGVVVERMAGLSHANTTGQFASLYLGIVILTYRRWEWSKSRALTFAIIIVAILALAALIESKSRTSMLGLMLALSVAMRETILRWTGPILPFLLGSLLSVGLFLSAVVPHGIFSLSDHATALTKTGDTEEITSMTGRTEIWAFSIEQLAKRPFLGYGLTTSKEILVDHTYYCHNMWLNIAFSCGIFAGAILVYLTLVILYNLTKINEPLLVFFYLFLFISGIVENIAFAYIPSAPTQLLLIGLVWQTMKLKEQSSSV